MAFDSLLSAFVFFFKQKTAYEMRISDWSSDVCSSDLSDEEHCRGTRFGTRIAHGPLGMSMAIGLMSQLNLINGTALGLLNLNWDFRGPIRSEERRVGKECVSTCRYRWSS